MSMRKLFIKKKLIKKGFTLIELLVSIAIFSIVSVIMSNIILENSKFALDTQRRTEFLSEMDKLILNIKNSTRSSGSLCSILGVQKFVYAKDANGNVKRLVVNKDHRIAWQYVDPATCMPLGTDLVPLTSQFINVFDLKISTVSTNANPGVVPQNTMLFISIEACDSSNIVFNCDASGGKEYFPYRYKFGIATRYE